MSHQTGIKANAELLKFFSKCKDGKTRVIKISIENEKLALVEQVAAKKNWEADFKTVPALVQPTVPCYILYRLDEKSSTGGYFWLLFSYVPDIASVREKMLYASTKATLKTEFGSANIKEDVHATQQDEVTLEGYTRHKRAFAAPAPLTTREEELAELRKTEPKADFSTDTRQQTMTGIAFPVTETAAVALRDFARRSYNYLQFRIEIGEEKIHLAKAVPNLELAKLPTEVPNDQARYHLFLFRHTHEGDFLESVIFVYSMPGYKCSVKERMLYSSCKAPFLELIQASGIEVAKNVEIDAGDELTEAFLQDELHPKKMLHRPAFAKPKGPPNRGAKRLIRSTD